MSKTPLKASPLEILTQDFLSMSIEATPGEEFGPGQIEVERKLVQEDDQNLQQWTIFLTLDISADEGQPPPPYTGRVLARGVYIVHTDFPQDPERLIRITGASMLYGAVRELISTFTARSPNGLITLPSVSFFERPPKEKSAAKKSTKKRSKQIDV